MKQLKNLLPIMLLALLVWNCEKDDQQTPADVSFHFLESKFLLENFEDPFIKENLKVDWDNYTIRPDSFSNALIYQFDTSIKGKLVNNEKQFEYKYQVLGQNQGNEWDFEIIRILANNATSVDNVSYFDPESFSGTLHHYDLKGKNTKSKAFKKGEMLGEITGMEVKGPTAESKEPPVSNEVVWVLITVKRYTDMYMYRGGGIYEYGYSVHNSTQHEWAFISTGGTHSTYGHEQGDVYHGHHAGPSAPEEPDDEHLEEIINKLTGKAKCVYDELSSIDNNLFKETIGAFIDDPEYNLTLQIGDCEGTDEGCTNGNDPYNIEITIENTSQNSLGLAALILHEGIHAEMHRYVSRHQSGVDPNNRARLLQLYAYYKGWGDKYNPIYSFTNYAHHTYMVENYVKRIASAVRELDNRRFPLNYYMAYGWEGLEESGYTASRLTEGQDTENKNLRAIVEANFNEFCN